MLYRRKGKQISLESKNKYLKNYSKDICLFKISLQFSQVKYSDHLN